MRDTTQIVPGWHPISGAPLGSVLNDYQVGRANQQPRPITYVGVGVDIESGEDMRWTLWLQRGRNGIYRTTSANPPCLPGMAVFDAVVFRALLDGDDGRYAAETMIPLARFPEEAWCDYCILDAPLALARDQAQEAVAMSMSSRELAASVRLEHGRWLIETGVGGMLQIHGSCATQEEAIVVARAIRDAAWVRRLEEIRLARGGTIRWGAPVVMPYEVQSYGAALSATP